MQYCLVLSFFAALGPIVGLNSSGGVPGVQMGAGISVQLPGGSNRREQFVWGSPGARRKQGGCTRSQVVYMRKGKAESVLTD